MILVRFYVLDMNGHISKPAEVLECVDDADALSQAAERMQPGTMIEVWDGARRLGKSEPSLGLHP